MTLAKYLTNNVSVLKIIFLYFFFTIYDLCLNVWLLGHGGGYGGGINGAGMSGFGRFNNGGIIYILVLY